MPLPCGAAAHGKGMTIRKPTPEQLARLMMWRGQALAMQPYMASILFAMQPVDSDEIEWFAVDSALRLYVNFEVVAALGDDRFAAQGLLHECGHVFGRHDERAKLSGVAPAEHSAWNIAGDCAINDDLVSAGHADRLTAHGACWLGDKIGLPLDQTVETYFAALRRKAAAANGQSQGTYSGCGSISGGEPAPGELGSGDLDGQAPGVTGIGRTLVVAAAAQAVVDYVKTKGRGSVPGGTLETAVGYLEPPQVPWQRELHSLTGHSIRQARGHRANTYVRPNRRFHAGIPMNDGRVRMPAKITSVPRIAFVRDTSGSMSLGDLTALTSEIVGIARKLGVRGKDLTILDVDAAVARVVDYRTPATLATVAGRGGTDMTVGIQHALALKQRPDVIIVGTDGDTPWPVTPTDVPVIACVVADTDRPLKNVPDWIRALRVAPHTVSS